MRYILLLTIVGAIYWYLTPQKTEPVVNSVTSTQTVAVTTTSGPVAGTNVLKRPLDRTHEVLANVRKNRDENAF